MTGPQSRQVSKVARDHFGVTEFREGQQELIEAVLEGRDALGVLPTGAGKSLCFQLPALLVPGATVIVTPLLALMQDQLDKLWERDLPSTRLSSALSAGEEARTERQIRRGDHEFIYVTPEQLEKEERLQTLAKANVSLFVVDEAHCISQWGHDFRPAYLSLADAVARLGRPRVLALTASATPRVQGDIIEQLGLRDPLIVRTSVHRDNLFYEVHRTVSEEAKRDALLKLLRGGTTPAIVYAATIKTVDALWEWLRAQDVRVERYHGRLSAADRERAQDAFMSGEAEVMVATKAFGLGIDKADIRLVVHYQFPDSPESYYQETGRAGRDGAPARAALLYQLEDRRIQSYFLGGKYPKRDEAQALYALLRRSAAEAPTRPLAATRLAELAGVPVRRARVVAAHLANAGVIERTSRGLRVTRPLTDEVLTKLLDAYEHRRRSDRERLDTMMRYAQRTGCRWRFMQTYFGEDDATDCGHCDSCRYALSQSLDHAAPLEAMSAP